MTNIRHERSLTDRAHRRSMEVSPADLVESLKDKLGTRLVAFIVDRDVSTISKWHAGGVTPTEDTLRPLRVAYNIFQLLEAAESDHTIRAWFIGMNPQLDDSSPAESLREGAHREVMAAARAFAAGG